MKKEKRTKIFRILAAAVLLSAGAMSVYAGYKSRLVVKNTISTGTVGISLIEFEKDENGKLIEYKNDKEILPAQTVSKIPRIICTEKPCYVRVKATWHTENVKDDGEVFTLTEKDFHGMSSDWIKAGDYYYYTRSLKKGDYVDFFESITFPEEFTENASGQKLIMDIEADAVQRRNFTPDFDSNDPWHGISVLKSVKERNGAVTESICGKSMKITFEGTSGKLVSNTDNFFEAFGEMMPGDERSGTVIIKNTTVDTQDISFSMEVKKEETVGDLLPFIALTLKNDGTVIYEGTIAEAAKAGKINLGRYKKGEKGKLDFVLKAASDIDNNLALAEGQINWIFQSISVKPQKTSAPSNEAASDSKSERNHAPVKTGDKTDIFSYLVFMSGSFFMIVVLILGRKRGER